MLYVRDFGKRATTGCACGKVGDDGGLLVEKGSKKDTRDLDEDG